MNNEAFLTDTKRCKHDSIRVDFDMDRARDMTSDEVQRTFPRFSGECPDCKTPVIKYASSEHYVMGDWL